MQYVDYSICVLIFGMFLLCYTAHKIINRILKFELELSKGDLMCIEFTIVDGYKIDE